MIRDHHSGWVMFALAFVGIIVSISAIPGSAQTLVVKPRCAKPNSNVSITGSGWAEPSPVCDYHFLFDGTEFAPKQPDGLFGPPNSTGTIPAGATAGNHIIKTELRITSNNQLLQCRQVTFKVVDSSKDPWKDGGGGIQLDQQSPNDGPNSRIQIFFNPTSVCDVSPCTNILYIQSRMASGIKLDGTTRRVTYVEQGWNHGADIDKDFTQAGVGIDRIFGAPVPYYGQPNGNSTAGSSVAPEMTASMLDSPARSDDSYPADIKTLKLDFETAVFCQAGDDVGTYFGKVTWHWSRDKGRTNANGAPDFTGTITFDAPNRDMPSQNLVDALNLWANNRNFQVPMPTPPVDTSAPCQ